MEYELRALTLAEILDAAFRLVQTEWRTLVGLSLIMQIPIIALSSQASWLYDPFADPFGGAAEPTPEMLMEFGVLWGAIMLAYLVLYPIVAGAVTASVGNFYLGREFSIGEAARAGVGAMLKLILSYIVMVVAIFVIFGAVMMGAAFVGALFAGLLESLGTLGSVVGGILAFAAGVYVFFWMFFIMFATSLLAPIIVLESEGVIGSVARAFRLGSTAKGRVIGVTLTAAIIVGFPVVGAQMMVGFVPYLGFIIWGIFQAIGFAFTTSVAVVLYFDLRCRAENYDLELLAQQVEAGPGLGQR